VKERVPFIESINTRLTFYQAIYLESESTMDCIWMNYVLAQYWLLPVVVFIFQF